MGSISLNFEDSMRVLNNEDAAPDARVIAACFVAFFVTNNHADDIDQATRAVVLKLSHMVAAEIYNTQPPTSVSLED